MLVPKSLCFLKYYFVFIPLAAPANVDSALEDRNGMQRHQIYMTYLVTSICKQSACFIVL